MTFGSAYSTLTSLQRKRYLFVCINRRAEDNPKGCCALKDSEEVYRELKAEIAARGLATDQPVKRLLISADELEAK